jgi:hypothetical protein
MYESMPKLLALVRDSIRSTSQGEVAIRLFVNDLARILPIDDVTRVELAEEVYSEPSLIELLVRMNDAVTWVKCPWLPLSLVLSIDHDVSDAASNDLSLSASARPCKTISECALDRRAFVPESSCITMLRTQTLIRNCESRLPPDVYELLEYAVVLECVAIWVRDYVRLCTSEWIMGRSVHVGWSDGDYLSVR